MDLRDYIKRAVQGDVPEDFYSANASEIDDINRSTLKRCFHFASITLIVLCLLSLVLESLQVISPGLYVSTIAILLAMIVYEYTAARLSRLWLYFFYLVGGAIIMFLCIWTSTFAAPTEPATHVLVALVAWPLFFITKPINSLLSLWVSAALFLIADICAKAANTVILSQDIVNLLIVVVVATAMVVFFRNMFLRSFRDTSKFRKAAYTDALTGITNRERAEERIRTYLKQPGTHCIMMLVDLDDFKGINDTLGHARGDEALRYIGESLLSNVRETDIVARFGGDEFLVCIIGASSYEFARNKGREIVQHVSRALEANVSFRITCSIGISSTGGKAHTFDELFEQADTALYHSKNEGKNCVTLFHDMQTHKVEQPLMLTIDDSRTARTVLRACFKNSFTIVEAENGIDGLALIEQHIDDAAVVILDLEMPGMKGDEVLKKVRSDPRFDHIAIVVASAYSENEASVLKLGADDMIEKPFDPEVAKLRVQRSIEHRSQLGTR